MVNNNEFVVVVFLDRVKMGNYKEKSKSFSYNIPKNI